MEQITTGEIPERPWQIVATDLFNFNHRDFLVIADSYSGFFDFVELTSTTSSAIIKNLKRWFATFGIPDQLNSDGGPQYSSSEFREFLQSWEIRHRTSSPEFARSNGLAERYVQEAKLLLKKCLNENADPFLALLNHRNTPRGNIGSPVQRLMGRRTKTLLPCLRSTLLPKLIDPEEVQMTLRKFHAKEKISADKGKTAPKVFVNGDQILWRKSPRHWVPAEVVGKMRDSNSYVIQTADGAKYRRNSWFLQPRQDLQPVIEDSVIPPPSSPSPESRSSIGPPKATPEKLKPSGSPKKSIPRQSTVCSDAQNAMPSTSVPSPPELRTASGRLVRPPLRFQTN